MSAAELGYIILGAVLGLGFVTGVTLWWIYLVDSRGKK